MTHLLDGLSNLPVSGCRQTTLISIVQFTSFVKELHQHRSVLPIDVFLADCAHVALTDLCPRQWSIQEGRRSLKLILKHLILLVNDIAASVVTVSVDKRRRVAVLLLILPNGCQSILPVLELEIPLHVTH